MKNGSVKPFFSSSFYNPTAGASNAPMHTPPERNTHFCTPVQNYDWWKIHANYYLYCIFYIFLIEFPVILLVIIFVVIYLNLKSDIRQWQNDLFPDKITIEIIQNTLDLHPIIRKHTNHADQENKKEQCVRFV